MHDTLGRTINYLRLSVTDRCNLRCLYCMPVEGIDQLGHKEILTFEDLLQIVTAASKIGVHKVRITGGEPLVRKGVIGLIGDIAQVPGIKEVTLTTNGLLLNGQVQALWTAGIRRLNVSLDSLQPQTFAEITRGGDLEKILSGLEEAENAGMRIKLNMVVMRGVNDQEVVPFAALSRRKSWSVRYIEYMPTIREQGWQRKVISGSEILEKIAASFPLEEIPRSPYCGPAKPYRIKNAPGTIGIITPMSDHFCGSCNRIRVTSTGYAKSCLLSEGGLDLKPALQQGDAGAVQIALQDVISGKPPEHQLNTDPDSSTPFSMSKIGG
ncbi:MAG TPA: GTP 3',8-cyclase MoaA [Geopsychrobacteraceae bacterium]|nr:GTP 3',8-cyclase MoaA [Geopsychrobacteraceae bacterium]